MEISKVLTLNHCELEGRLLKIIENQKDVTPDDRKPLNSKPWKTRTVNCKPLKTTEMLTPNPRTKRVLTQDHWNHMNGDPKPLRTRRVLTPNHWEPEGC